MDQQPLKSTSYGESLDPPSYSAYKDATAPPGMSAWQPPPANYPPGYYPSTMQAPPATPVPTYGSTQSTVVLIPETILIGACPACRVGVMEDDYTCLGLLCAILFFPFGLICCMLLKTKRCSNCGAYFG